MAGHEYGLIADMHTNGILLQSGKAKHGMIAEYARAGLGMITFSVASPYPDVNYGLMKVRQDIVDLVGQSVEAGLQVRCSLVVNRQGISDYRGIIDYIMEVGSLGVSNVVVREVWNPDSYDEMENKVFDWNRTNFVPIGPLQDEFFLRSKMQRNPHRVEFQGWLPWGVPIFGVGSGRFADPDHEVQVTFAICDQPTVGNVRKSIVHTERGEGFTSWTRKGGRVY